MSPFPTPNCLHIFQEQRLCDFSVFSKYQAQCLTQTGAEWIYEIRHSISLELVKNDSYFTFYVQCHLDCSWKGDLVVYVYVPSQCLFRNILGFIMSYCQAKWLTILSFIHSFNKCLLLSRALKYAEMVKNLPAMAETRVQSLGQEDSLEKGMTTQYSCLENSIDREAWRAIVHGVMKSWTWLND